MSNKIYTSGNYVIIEEDGRGIFQFSKSKTIYNERDKDGVTNFVLNESEDGRIFINQADVTSGDWFEEDGITPFTVDGLRTFFRDNTANFSSASGGSGVDPSQGLFAKWNGVQYDYFLTLSDAFGSIVDGDTLIQLKDFNQIDTTFSGYSIANKSFQWQMNGYEFRHDFDEQTIPMIKFDNCNVNIRNGKIIKDATIVCWQQGATIHGDNGTELTLYGVEVSGINTVKTYITNHSKIYGGYYTGERQAVYLQNGSLGENLDINLDDYTAVFALTNCIVKNANIVTGGLFGGGIVALSNSRVENCTVLASASGIQASSDSIISNCYAFGGSGRGITANGATVNNSTGESATGLGIFSEDGILNNCQGISSVSWGIVFQKGTIANNCVGISNSSYGMRNFSTDATKTMRITNCKSISENFIGGLQSSSTGHAIYHNFSCLSLWNNVGGHALQVSKGISATLEILGGSMEVVNSGANGLFNPNAGAFSVDYAKLTFRGMTTAVSAVISQGIVAVEDAQGNILI
jgi:hypothetical protein